MATVHDVAAYILQKQGAMTAMKLQKLVYYSQAWGLVWDGAALFDEEVQAWANGPVVPALYSAHRGSFVVSASPRGNAAHLSPKQIATIDAVLNFYGDKEPEWLSNLTHQEKPWIAARAGVAPGERSEQPISQQSMYDYYSSLG